MGTRSGVILGAAGSVSGNLANDFWTPVTMDVTPSSTPHKIVMSTGDGVLTYEGGVICDVVTLRGQLDIPTVPPPPKAHSDDSMSSREPDDMPSFIEREGYLGGLLIKED